MIETRILSNGAVSIGRIVIYDGCSLEITPETWTNKELRKSWINLNDKYINELEKTKEDEGEMK